MTEKKVDLSNLEINENGQVINKRNEKLKIITTGWQCPRCNRVYALWIKECKYCNNINNYIKYDVSNNSGGEKDE